MILKDRWFLNAAMLKFEFPSKSFFLSDETARIWSNVGNLFYQLQALR